MAFDLGTARGKIELLYSGGAAKKAVTDMVAMDKAGTKASTSVGKLRKTLLLGAGGAALAVAGGLAVAVKTAASFEKQMSAVAAVSGATDKQLDSLRSKALQLGADTAFSANEAGLAMEELVKAGLTIPQVLNGAADATVNLAAAAGIELPEAATISANAMNQFNLTAKDMTSVVDDIAGVANTSAIDVGEFGQSLKQVGAVANLVGFSFEDTAAAIGIMGDAGIVGSDAGTSLKTMLLNLQPTTEKQTELFRELGLVTKDGSNRFFDAQGNIKSLAGVAGVLEEALKGQTRQQKLANLETLFGTDAIRGAAIIAGVGAKGVDKFTASMNKVSAADVAAKRLDNFEGSLEQLKGSLETLAILIGTPLLSPLRSLVDLATRGANALGDMASGAKEPPEALQQVAAAAKDVWQSLENMWDFLTKSDSAAQGLVTNGLTVIIAALRVLSSLLETVTGAFDNQGSAVVIAAAAWLLLGSRITTAMTFMKTVPTRVAAATSAMANSATRAQALGAAARNAAGIAGMGALIISSQQSSGAIRTLGSVAGGALTGFAAGGPWGAAIGAGAGLLLGLAGSTDDASAAQREFAASEQRSKEASDELVASLNQQTGAMTKQTRVAMAKFLSQNREAQTLMSQTGVDLRTLTQAHLGNKKAISAVLAITRAYNKSLGPGGMGFNIKALAQDLRGANTPLERQAALIRASIHASEGWKQSTANLDELIAAAKQGKIDFSKYSQAITNIPKAARTEILGLGLNATIQDVKNLQKEYDGVDGRDVRAIIQALGLDDTINKTSELDGNLDHLDGRHVTTVIDHVTNMITHYQTSFERGVGPGQSLYNKDGNVLSYANGGYAAGVYSGTRIKFAEAGTEAYIPFRQDKRKRAERILSMVASSFGGAFVKMAEGGMLAMAAGGISGLSTGSPRQTPAATQETRQGAGTRDVHIVINNPEAERSSMSIMNTLTIAAHQGYL